MKRKLGAALVLAGGVGLLWWWSNRRRTAQLQLIQGGVPYGGLVNTGIQPQFDRTLSTPAPTLKLVQATATAPAGSPMAARLQKLGV